MSVSLSVKTACHSVCVCFVSVWFLLSDSEVQKNHTHTQSFIKASVWTAVDLWPLTPTRLFQPPGLADVVCVCVSVFELLLSDSVQVIFYNCSNFIITVIKGAEHFSNVSKTTLYSVCQSQCVCVCVVSLGEILMQRCTNTVCVISGVSADL